MHLMANLAANWNPNRSGPHKMKPLFLIPSVGRNSVAWLTSVLLWSLAVNPLLAQDSRLWVTSIGEAQQLAARRRCLVLVHFWDHNCPPCSRVERNVLSSPEVERSLAMNYVAVRVNVSESAAIADRYKVLQWPTDVILTPDGKEVFRSVSQQDPVRYIGLLDRVATQTRLARPAESVASQQLPSSSQAGYSNQTRDPLQVAGNEQDWQYQSQSRADGGPRYQGTVNGNESLAGVANSTQTDFGPGIGSIAPNARNTLIDPVARVQRGPYGPPSNTNAVAANPDAVPQADNSGSSNSNGSRWESPSGRRSRWEIDPNAPREVVANPTLSHPPANPREVSLPSGGGAPAGSAPAGSTAAGSTAAGSTAAGSTAAGGTAAGGSSAVGASAVSAVNDAPNPAGSQGEPGYIENRYVTRHTAAAKSPLNVDVPAAVELPAPPVIDEDLPPIALDGYCPVTLFQENRWAKGNPEFGARHRGRSYLFAGQEECDKFFANPDKYSPMLGGYDPVLLLETKKWVAGLRQHGIREGEKMYLFSSEQTLQKFFQERTKLVPIAEQAMRQQATGRIR